MDYQPILEQLRAEYARVCGDIAAVEQTLYRHPSHACRKKAPVSSSGTVSEPPIACQHLLKLVQRYTVLSLKASAQDGPATRLDAEAAWRASEKHRLEHGC